MPVGMFCSVYIEQAMVPLKKWIESMLYYIVYTNVFVTFSLSFDVISSLSLSKKKKMYTCSFTNVKLVLCCHQKIGHNVCAGMFLEHGCVCVCACSYGFFYFIQTCFIGQMMQIVTRQFFYGM